MRKLGVVVFGASIYDHDCQLNNPRFANSAKEFKRITADPEILAGFQTETLDLYNNQLGDTIPLTLGNLASLQTLRLYNNQLSTLPESLGNLTRLKELHVMNNLLVSLPESIGKLEYLKELRVSNNRLTSLPTSLGNLRCLTILARLSPTYAVKARVSTRRSKSARGISITSC